VGWRRGLDRIHGRVRQALQAGVAGVIVEWPLAMPTIGLSKSSFL
jgi:hypothetical protein